MAWDVWEDGDIAESFDTREEAEAFVTGCPYYASVVETEKTQRLTRWTAVLSREASEEDGTGTPGAVVEVTVEEDA